MKTTAYLALGSLALALSSVAVAKDINYNIVRLSDSAQMSVPQNQLNVNLVVETRADAREAASRDNTLKLNRVLQAVENAGLKGEITNRSVREQNDYENGKIVKRGWRDAATLNVFSEDTAAVNRVVAAVQQDARLESQSYGLTNAARREYELQLTEQAIANFRKQADRVSAAFGSKRYRIVELSVDTAGGNAPRRMPVLYAAKAVMAESAPVAADMAGEADIQVNVGGSIQFY